MQITKQGDRLLVPDHPVIPFIEGDGIGKEITPFVQQIIDAAVKKKLWRQKKDYLAGSAGGRKSL